MNLVTKGHDSPWA